MPGRLKLIVAYDGAPFAGWQSQAGGNTIQDQIERAIEKVSGQQVRIHGAGRTDAGVHALAQCAHFDSPTAKLTPERWAAALNASLPPTIRIVRCSAVPQTFHARFSAKGKTYRYRIWNDRVLSPLEIGRAWHVAAPLPLELVRNAAQSFVGTHDFATFAANRGAPEQHTVRTIHTARVRKSGSCLMIEMSGDGFLYKMVRLMVGALVRCGLGQSPPDQIEARLAIPEECSSASRFAAPADGLFLVRVRY